MTINKNQDKALIGFSFIVSVNEIPTPSFRRNVFSKNKYDGNLTYNVTGTDMIFYEKVIYLVQHLHQTSSSLRLLNFGMTHSQQRILSSLFELLVRK